MTDQASTLLRDLRRARGLSQRALARAAGVPASTVSRIEAGQVDPTVGMLARLTAAAGTTLALHVASGTLTLAWLALRSDHRDLDWTAARGLADWVTQHPQTVAAIVADPPPATGSLVVDNLIAAIAETMADDAHLAPPQWCQRLQPLPEEWAPQGTPAMRRRWRDSTPPRFARRNLWCAGNTIWRHRDDETNRAAATA